MDYITNRYMHISNMDSSVCGKAKPVSLHQIMETKTPQHTPFRVTADGEKFKLIAKCFDNRSQMLFFFKHVFYYGGALAFELEYKSANEQIYFLTPDNKTIQQFIKNPSNFSAKDGEKLQLYIDIWNAEIFDPVPTTDAEYMRLVNARKNAMRKSKIYW